MKKYLTLFYILFSKLHGIKHIRKKSNKVPGQITKRILSHVLENSSPNVLEIRKALAFVGTPKGWLRFRTCARNGTYNIENWIQGAKPTQVFDFQAARRDKQISKISSEEYKQKFPSPKGKFTRVCFYAEDLKRIAKHMEKGQSGHGLCMAYFDLERKQMVATDCLTMAWASLRIKGKLNNKGQVISADTIKLMILLGCEEVHIFDTHITFTVGDIYGCFMTVGGVYPDYTRMLPDFPKRMPLIILDTSEDTMYLKNKYLFQIDTITGEHCIIDVEKHAVVKYKYIPANRCIAIRGNLLKRLDNPVFLYIQSTDAPIYCNKNTLCIQHPPYSPKRKKQC